MKKNRILELFEKNKDNKAKYFMPFLVAGDPTIEQFKKLVLAIEPFADILEIGIPFSDPIADGPTIQEANMRAFKSEINTDLALKAIGEIRMKTSKPIIILTYYNILIQGSNDIEISLDNTFKKLKENGVDGIVIADLPIEESELALKICEKYNIYLIFLVAPSTTDERLERILKAAKGFLYLISVMGVTGTRDTVAQITKDTIKRIKGKLIKNIPILVGFGISKPEHVKEIIEAGADGVIIGSAIVKIIQKNLDDPDKIKSEMIKFASDINITIKRISGGNN